MKTEYNKRLEEEILKLNFMLKIAYNELKKSKSLVVINNYKKQIQQQKNAIEEKNNKIKKLNKDIQHGEEVKRLKRFIEGSKEFLTKKEFLSLFNDDYEKI